MFTIYTADLTDWVKNSILFNYADDTSYSMAGRIQELVIKKLEEDADRIPQMEKMKNINPTYLKGY